MCQFSDLMSPKGLKNDNIRFHNTTVSSSISSTTTTTATTAAPPTIYLKLYIATKGNGYVARKGTSDPTFCLLARHWHQHSHVDKHWPLSAYDHFFTQCE
jgi:hypothetical protein